MTVRAARSGAVVPPAVRSWAVTVRTARSGAVVPAAALGAAVLSAAVVALPADSALVNGVLEDSSGGWHDLGPLAAVALVCCAVFAVWPWAVLPVTVTGVVQGAHLLGDGSFRMIMMLHAFLLLTGCVGVLLHHLVPTGADHGRFPDPPGSGPVGPGTVADLPMLLLGVLVLAAVGYGLLLGHPPYRIMLAGYHFAIVPLYFFLATRTLTGPRPIRSATVLFLVLTTTVTLAGLTAPGRHGGMWTLIAALPLLVVGCQLTGWRRVVALALTALFMTDVVLSAFRTTWVAAGVALLVLLVRGTRRLRQAVAGMGLATAVLLAGALTVNAGVRTRAVELSGAFSRDAGFRVPEAEVGMRVFAAHPIFGAGLGQSTPETYLAGLGTTNVGPLYHVYYVMVLANLGLLGMFFLLWPILRATAEGLAQRDGPALAFAALICGFLVSVLFSGPTNGHWELGLLPALLLIAKRSAPIPPRRPPRLAVVPGAVVPAARRTGFLPAPPPAVARAIPAPLAPTRRPRHAAVDDT